MNETTPLILGASERLRESQGDEVPNKDIVEFDPNGDAENPMDWPEAYKWGIVALLASMAFTVTFTCISVIPIATLIVDDLAGGGASKSASVLLVTIWELGEAAGPLFIAPLSEIYGRYPIINVANIFFVAFTMLAALCQSSTLFIAVRALTGLAVASNVLSPAIVGDMFVSEQRGAAMSLIQLAPLVGGAVGPAISGAVAQSIGWRQTLWMSATLAGACELAFLTLFRETYKVPILKRKAARLRAETGNQSLKTVFDIGDGKRGSKIMWKSIMRPAIVLAGSCVLQVLSLFGSFVFSYFYILSTSLPNILRGIYGFTPAATGAAFIVFSVGSAISVIICNLVLDRIYIRLRDAHKGPGQPEYRLPLVIIGSVTMPLAIAAYGWCAQLHLHASLLLLSVGLVGLTQMFTFLPLMAYVVDGFGLYSASAVTAVIVTRCLMGTFLPLTTGPLVDNLGYGIGFTVFAFASACTVPIPVLVFRNGRGWRQSSKYTKD